MIRFHQPCLQSLLSVTGETVASSGETAPSRGEKIKEAVVLGVLHIALPSGDVFSDLAMIGRFYIGSRTNPYCDEAFKRLWDNVTETFYDDEYGLLKCYYNDDVPTTNMTYTPHYIWGTLMLLPFLLNYLICWYVWATVDKRKAVTWVVALLNLYPQYVASKIIWEIWNDPKRGLQKKRLYQRNVLPIQTFCEAVPSTLIMTFLIVRTLERNEGSEVVFDWLDPTSHDCILFFVAYSTSIITSSLGLAKNLKEGPCRILPEQKIFLRGFLAPRFILIFFTCGLTLVGKGLALASAVADFGPCVLLEDILLDEVATRAAICVSVFFLPGFLVSLFSCWHQGILKTFLAQPSILFLPVFTHFTFVTKWCGGAVMEDSEGGEERAEVERRKGESFITFSPKYTAVTTIGSVAGVLLCIVTLFLETSDWDCATGTYIAFGHPFTILGVILTLVVGFSNQCNSCHACHCYACCFEPFEFGALLTSSPHTPYILGPDGHLVREENINLDENNEEEVALETKDIKDLFVKDNQCFLHSSPLKHTGGCKASKREWRRTTWRVMGGVPQCSPPSPSSNSMRQK